MNILENRIISLRKALGYSQEKFAQKLNLSRNFINQIEAGKKNPSDRTILDICREFNANEEWLRTGEGEMFIDRSQEDYLADLTLKLLGEEPKSFRNRLVAALSKLTDDQWDVLEQVIDDISAQKKE
jgi:transcriptional regulator with XRE-family HTH domain